jgi:tyrosinase
MKAFIEKGFQNNDIVSDKLRKAEWSWEKDPKMIPEHLSLEQAVSRLLSKDYYPSFAEFVTTTFIDAADAKLFLSLEAIHK